ncbi:MAG: hypothetical protein V1492_05710 [Candidatus Micrarchaeota archaeon]
MEIIRLKTTAELLNHKGRKAVAVLDDYAYDEGAVGVIAEKKALVILVAFDSLLTAHGMARARLFSKMRNFLKLCARFGALYAIGFEADARTGKYAVREQQETIVVGQLLGLNRGQAKMASARFKDLFVK